jgi:hypothetical protein
MGVGPCVDGRPASDILSPFASETQRGPHWTVLEDQAMDWSALMAGLPRVAWTRCDRGLFEGLGSRIGCLAYTKGARCSRDCVRCSTAGSGVGRDRKAAERTGARRFRRRDEPRDATDYLPAELSSAQRLQRGRLPVPRARFRSSMLLPSMHRVLLWCFIATGRVEYHGPWVGIASFLRFVVTSRHIARVTLRRMGLA